MQRNNQDLKGVFPSKIRFYLSFIIQICFLYLDLTWDVVLLISFYQYEQYGLFIVTSTILLIQPMILIVWHLSKSYEKEDSVIMRILKTIKSFIFGICHIDFWF